MKTAIYPGSFDPFHEGHLNVLKKALNLFDEVYVVISVNINKIQKSDFESRKKQVLKMTKDLKNVTVLTNENQLTITKALELNTNYLIRGLRSSEDFDHELEYYDGIKKLNSNFEIIYFISDQNKRKISSSMLKEIEHFKNRG